jgi:ketosteroid isomerase-like protein
MRLSAMLLMLPLSAAMAETPTVMDAYALANQSNAAWAEKYAAGDAAAVASAYTSDALVVPPAAAPIQGTDAISNYWRQRLADGQQIYVRVESADLRGNALVQSGVWSVQVTNEFGERAYGGGEFKRILDKQQDGSYRIRLETWDVSSEAASDKRVSMNW